MEEEQMY